MLSHVSCSGHSISNLASAVAQSRPDQLISKKMEGKSSSQIVRFFIRSLPIAFTHLKHVAFKFGFFSKILKCSFGHVESSFDNPAENFSAKIGKVFAQNPKKIQNDCFFNAKICKKKVLLKETVHFKKAFILLKGIFDEGGEWKICYC